MSPAEAFLAALSTALANDGALGALLASGRGVALSAPFPAYLEAAPPDEPYPYITFSIPSDNAWDVSEGFGAEALIDVHSWTRGTSPTANFALRSRIEAICRDPAWTLSGFNLVLCRPSARRMMGEDQQIFHGVVTLRVLIEAW